MLPKPLSITRWKGVVKDKVASRGYPGTVFTTSLTARYSDFFINVPRCYVALCTREFINTISHRLMLPLIQSGRSYYGFYPGMILTVLGCLTCLGLYIEI